MPLWDVPEYETDPGYLMRSYPYNQILVLPSLIKTNLFSTEMCLSSAWCSAANDFCPAATFAVGFDDRVSMILEAEDHFSYDHNAGRRYDGIFSVDWLDHDTIISGGRRGVVALWDTRTRGDSVRFRHPTAINHVRKLEGPRVAITGTNESVS